jgi:hypothetical protein
MTDDASRSDARSAQASVRRTVRDEETPASCAIDLIAAVTDTPPTGLRPLSETIDPDALNRLLESAPDCDGDRAAVSVSFHHEGCEVLVRSDGQLAVTSQTESR